MDNAQILKGLLEGCILKLIDKERTYGYKICEELASGGFQKVNEGTIYPILIRLENKGLISSEKLRSPLGPQRKYFIITKKGKEHLSSFSQEWEITKKTIDHFIVQGGYDG